VSQETLWKGRFKVRIADEVLSFTSSLSWDRRLAWYDVVGSIAHVKMLCKQKIIEEAECDRIIDQLKELLIDIETNKLVLPDNIEDIHSGIEFLLVNRLGSIGKKVHTARSRNDQVVTDLRMLMRDCTLVLMSLLSSLEEILLNKAAQNLETIMPGFTHLQHAQPITLAHHLLAHFSKLERDFDRFAETYKRINVCPLGSAALAGTTFNIDRSYTSQLLGFDRPSRNSIDAVSDRDFVSEFIYNCAMTMIHLSSLCEELIIWSTPEFGFVEFDDTYATGSSIMPQKKNPDIAELIRGKTARVVGNLNAIMMLAKGLPLSYNRDLQEDKPLLFDALDTTRSSLEILVPAIKTLRFDKEKMRLRALEGYLNATDLADYLVLKGVPFRDAHEVSAKIVRYAIEKGKKIEELSVDEMRRFSERIDDDVIPILSVEACVKRRRSYGGTSPDAVKKQIEECTEILKRQKELIKKEKLRLKKVWKRLLS
jgi:argininosuccinate lyase